MFHQAHIEHLHTLVPQPFGTISILLHKHHAQNAEAYTYIALQAHIEHGHILVPQPSLTSSLLL